MPLRKDFLHTLPYFPMPSRNRLVAGIALGLLFAFSFYGFLYCAREAIRLLFMGRDNQILIFTDAQVMTYNIFFAYISTILGQSLCFVYWLDRPIGKFGKYRFKVRVIINDQRGFNSYFLSWFSRICYTIAVVFGGFMLFPAYSTEDVYPRYNIFLVIIILVLFLHSWMNIRRLFLGKSWKWMCHSFVILTILSFGLSCINFVNYKEINRMALKRNVWHNYHIVLPESDIYDNLSQDYRRRATIMLVGDKVNATEPVLLFKHAMDRTISYNDFHRIALDSLYSMMKEGDEKFYYEEDLFNPCVLYIDKDMKMKHVNKLKYDLAKAGVIPVEYAVVPVKREYNIRYYDYLGFSRLLPTYYKGQKEVKDMEGKASAKSCIINVTDQDDLTLLVNDSLMERNAFSDWIKTQIRNHLDDYAIKYYISDDSPYRYFLRMNVTVQQVVNNLRDEYSRQAYQKEYQELEYEEQGLVRKQIPVNLWEITEEIGGYLKSIN